MATTLVKGLAAAGALGTASGVGTLVYLNTGTTISKKLTDKWFTLISNDEDYKFSLFDKQNHEKLKQVLGLESIDHTKHVSNLKKWCDENLDKWASNDKDNSIFDNAKVWCVLPQITTLGQKIKGDFYPDGEWQGKYETFAKEPTRKDEFLAALKAQFSSFTFTDKATGAGDKFKAWCEETKRTKTYEADKYRTEKNLKDWCVKS